MTSLARISGRNDPWGAGVEGRPANHANDTNKGICIRVIHVIRWHALLRPVEIGETESRMDALERAP